MKLLLILKIVLSVVATVSVSNIFSEQQKTFFHPETTYFPHSFFATLHDIRFDLL
jgi:hypothetical protein